jgi:hypothetical protein
MEKQINIPVTAQVTAPITQDNPIQLILDDVKNKLAAINELKYIDNDWGQLDGYSPNFPVKWPCALVDVSDARYSNIGKDTTMLPQNRQQGEIILTITIATLRLSPSNQKAPAGKKPGANNIYLIIQTVHELLHGYSPTPQAGLLIRTGMQRIRRDDGVHQYTIQYATAIHNV